MPISAGAKGRSDLILQPDRVVFDPVRGAIRYRSWLCVDNDKINAQALIFIELGLPYEISTSGTMHRIEVQIFGADTDLSKQLVPVDRWDMPPNEIQKTVWEHPKLLAVNDDIIGIANQQASAGNKFDDFIAALDAADLTADWDLLSPATQTLVKKFYSLAKRGSDHWGLGQYAVKHTSTVGPRYDANIADINVGKLYTTAQLLAEVTDPLLWSYPLPGRLIFKIQNISAPPSVDDFLWSWRKLSSGETTTAGGRIEITTEYWLELFSVVDYDPVI